VNEPNEIVKVSIERLESFKDNKFARWTLHITFGTGMKSHYPVTSETLGPILNSLEAQEAVEEFLNKEYPDWRAQLIGR